MASGWDTATLGDLVSFKTGKLDSNASVPDGKYPFFTCSQETLRTNTYSFDTECVLLAGNNANGIYPLKYFYGKFDAYQRTYVITVRDPGRLITKYLYYALRPKLSEFRRISTGAATKFLTLTILNRTELQIPPVAVQRRISEILSSYDELIQNSERRIRALEAMARAVFREWFIQLRFPGHETIPRYPTSLGDIPEGWEARKVSDFADFVRGVEPGSEFYCSDPGPDRIRFLRVGDLSKRDSDIFISVNHAAGKILMPQDIALTLDGSVGLVRIGLSGAYSTGIRKVLARDQARLGWAFIYLLLLSEQVQSTIRAHAKGTTIKHAGSAVAALEFVSPPARLVERFEALAAPMLKQTLALNDRIRNLRRTRDLLLSRLLSGQLEAKAN